MEGKKKGNVKADDKKQELLTNDVKEEPEESLVETCGKTSGKDKPDKGDITKKVTSARIVLTPVKIDKEGVATRKRAASGTKIVEPEEKSTVSSGNKGEPSIEGQPKEAVAKEKASLLKKLGLEVASGKKKAKLGGSKKGSSELDTASKKDAKSPVKSAFNKKSIAVEMGKKNVKKNDEKNDESDEEEEENSESSLKDEKRAIASPPKKSRRLRGKLDSGDEAVETVPAKTLPVRSSPIKTPKTSLVKSKRGLDQDDDDSDDDGEGTDKKDIARPPKKRAKNWNKDSQEKKENSKVEDKKDVKNKTAAEKKTMKKDSGGSESKKSATKPKKKLSDKFWYMVSESEDSDEEKVEVFTPEVSSAMRARRASKLSSKLKEWGFVQGSGSSKSSDAHNSTPAAARGRPKSAIKPKVSATKTPPQSSSQDDSMHSTPSTDDKPVGLKKESTESTPVATSSKKKTMTTSTGKAASTSKTVASTTLKLGSSKAKAFTTKLGTVTMKFGTGTPKLTTSTPKSVTTITSKLGTITKLEGATHTSAETTKVALTPKPGVVLTKSGVVVSKTGLTPKSADVGKSAEKQATSGWIAKTVTVGGVTRRVVVPASKVGDISDLSKSVNVKPAAGNWVQKTMTVGTQKVIISSDGIKVLPVSSSDTEKTSKGVTTAYTKSSPSAVNYIVPQSRPSMLCKSLMCKPIMMTKATTCAPIHIHRSTQTEQIGEPKKTVFVPVPVPMMVPVPVPQCTMPTPYPLPMPIPVPVPCFVPTTKKLVESLMKQLQELADTLPTDPLEAELLAMAELVESTKDDQGAESTDLESVTYGGSFLDKQGAGDGAGSGDMLEMAMRIASEIPDMASEKPEVVKVDPLPVLQMNDSHMKLKYSYGVNAYRYWVQQKNAVLEKAPIGVRGRTKLFKLDLMHCTADELNIALCLFVKEVRKPTGEEYAADSILYLCLGIQHYLYLNGRIDNIFADVYYSRFTECLNELLGNFEMRLNEQGVLICRVTEEHLWESRQLGAHSPKVLLNTLIYFNTKYFHLNTPEAHTNFTFVNVMKTTRKKPGSADSQRTVYLRYNASILGDQSKKSKSSSDQSETSFEQMENSENPLRCPVKLYEFYLSKCPESVRNRGDIFYLKPEPSCVPDSPVWFSPTALPTNILGMMLNRIKVVREIQEAQLNHMHQN